MYQSTLFMIPTKIGSTDHIEQPFDYLRFLQCSKRKMDVLFDIDEYLIKTFQIAPVFLNVAVRN